MAESDFSGETATAGTSRACSVSSLAPGALFARLPGLLAAAVTGECFGLAKASCSQNRTSSFQWRNGQGRSQEVTPTLDGEQVSIERFLPHTESCWSPTGTDWSEPEQKIVTGRKQERKRAGRKQKRTDRQQKRDWSPSRNKIVTGRKQEQNCAESEDGTENRTDRTQEFVGPREGDRKRSRRDDDRTRNVRGRQERILGAATWSNNMSGHRTDKVNDEDKPFNRFVYAFSLRRDHAEEDLREWLHEPTVVAA